MARLAYVFRVYELAPNRWLARVLIVLVDDLMWYRCAGSIRCRW